MFNEHIASFVAIISRFYMGYGAISLSEEVLRDAPTACESVLLLGNLARNVEDICT